MIRDGDLPEDAQEIFTEAIKVTSWKNYIETIQKNLLSVYFVWGPGENILFFLTFRKIDKQNKKYEYKKGQEIGMFNLGSTVIMLISGVDVNWEDNIITNNKILIRDEVLKLS